MSQNEVNELLNEIGINYVAYWVNYAKTGKDTFDKLTDYQIQLITDYIKLELDNYLQNGWDYDISSFEGISVNFSEYDEDYNEGDDTINLSGEDLIKIKYNDDMVKVFDKEIKDYLLNNWRDYIRSVACEDDWDIAKISFACYIDNTTTEDIIIMLGYEVFDEPMLK
jgi:hypothetical protein